MEDSDEDIAVVGIGCNFPGEERFDSAFWYDPDDRKAGKTQTAKAALIDGLNEFDHKFFGITEAEADLMDPQQKLLLECTYRALENAGIPMEKASATRTGVFIGLMNRDYETLLNNSPTTITHYNGTGTAMSIAANRISYTFNFTGPSLAIDSACSSSLVALHLAAQAIRQGDCEMAVCGGVSCILEPRVFVALSKAKMISPEGTSKPFSSRADGYGRGEGCGIVLLKPLRKAVKDFDHIWGVISRTVVNQDGRFATPITRPSMDQQEELLHRIYSAEIDPSHVQYIEAHGTGTPVGDPTEAGAISRVIAKARPPGSEVLCIGSVKGNIGHTESAAGVAGLIKVLLMMHHETIVPSLFYSEDGASIDAKALNLRIPTTVAIASLLKHWGVRPDGILGHSVGEVAAAHCSGLLSLEDAVKVIHFRSTLQSKVTGGKMLVVSNIAVSEIQKLLPAYSGKVCLAAFNSPQSCTLSGDADAVDSLHQKLKTSFNNKNLFLHILDVSTAYHSHMMDPILTQIEDSIGLLQENELEAELFSTVTGQAFSQGDFTTGKYWARNVRAPVAFEQALRSAAKGKENIVFVEIGPRRALQRNIMETLGNDITVFSSVQPDKDHVTLVTAMSKLFELGMQVNWERFYRGHEAPPTPFPKYQFDSIKKEVNFEAVRRTIEWRNEPIAPDEQNLSVDMVFKRCRSIVTTEEAYAALHQAGFQYSSVFRHLGDVHYGEEYKEAVSILRVPDETVMQLQDYCIHPVVLDHFLQMAAVVAMNGFTSRPGFPSAIGCITVSQPLRNEMVVYLRMTKETPDGFELTFGQTMYWNKHTSQNHKLLALDFSGTVTAVGNDVGKLKDAKSYFSSGTTPVVVLDSNIEDVVSDLPLQGKPKQLFKKNSVYIVTGGLSGLGFETVKFVAQRGGGFIVILSRSAPSSQLHHDIAVLQNQHGVSVISIQCDVSIPEQVAKAVVLIGQRFPSCPIRGVFHSAAIVHDGLLENLDKSHFEKVFRPKVNGALNLHDATIHCKLDYFVCYSSISSFIGNASQTNYAAANSFLDMFCHYRRRLGLAGQSINWGAFNIGLLLNKDPLQKFLEAKGTMVMEVAQFHQGLELCLLQNNAQQVVCKFNFKNLRNHVLSQNTSLKVRLSALVDEELKNVGVTESRVRPATSPACPGEYVRTLLSETCNVDIDELNEGTALSAMGVDSMVSMTLQNLIFQDRGINVPLVKLLDPNSTLSTLVSIVKEGREWRLQEDTEKLALSLNENLKDEYTEF
ncbi:hypothetical protein JZ751_008242 [Albula glossodonta]|uniref:Carrier domain-containing protein n=1 Tax=Albula glossodonta TaxID=121402 RepID=A0A8T2N384_9TELE|nr:hypothetical protein JZ751_008242 [Albula glossodonta]